MNRTIDRWTNGANADVTHFISADGTNFIEKRYCVSHFFTFLREFCVLKYLGPRTSCVPNLHNVDFSRRRTLMEFVAGERVLEWVLKRFGRAGLEIDEFKNFHGLEANEDVEFAFARLRESQTACAARLKSAISKSYLEIHRLRFVHGDPSPRNLIFDGDRIYIIDFDHSRPSLNPGKVDGSKILKWYGIQF